MASQRELDHQWRMKRLQFFQDMGIRASYVAIALVIGGTIYLSVRALAGRTTLADVAFGFAADMKANKPLAIVVSWLLTGTTGTWAVGERVLRRRYIKTHAPLIKRYQESLDPKRGSSELTERGTTQARDI